MAIKLQKHENKEKGFTWYTFTMPKSIVEAMGWEKGDNLHFMPYPEKNKVVIGRTKADAKEE